VFASQSQAKTFFVDKIVGQARAERHPLSDNERWMLRFSESDPEFQVDLARMSQFEAEISDNDYENKIVGLLQRAYQRDVEADGGAQALYRAASRALHQGDHYLLVMIDQVLGPAARGHLASPVLHLFGQAALFVVLVLPGSLAILFAIVIAVGVLTGQMPALSMIGSLVLGGMGYYLFHLWRREHKSGSLNG
jgi:hypothetical protein